MRSTRKSGCYAAVLLFFACGVLLSSGCARYTTRAEQIRHAFYVGDLPKAEAMAAEAVKKDRQAKDMFKLDQAIIALTKGDARTAEQKLREVRDQFDANEGKGLTERTGSYLTDENAIAYEGEDYEKVLVRAFLALSNLFEDGGDTEAYCLQMIDKQQKIIDAGKGPDGENPKQHYQRVALAPYLRGILRESTHRSYDDVERSYVDVCSWQPEFVSGPVDLERARSGVHSQKGNGVLYVFALVGKGPVKQAVVEVPSSAALQAASFVLGMTCDPSVPYSIAPIEVPQVMAQANRVAGIGVAVDEQPIGMTQTITDVTKLATEQYAAIFPQIVGKAVARRIVKKGAAVAAKQSMGVSKQSFPNVLVDVTEMVWEAVEKPDTRSWQLLPDKIQVLRIELPAGEHQIALDPANAAGIVVGPPVVRKVVIEDGRNTYMLGNFPEPELLGELLIRTP